MKQDRGYQRRRTAGSAPGAVRIVGGRWRGRRLRVADVRGLRPTPGRTRETLFNWLQGRVDGAHVLDLFAGSGALAFEALSRGAAAAVLVERDRRAIDTLRAAARSLDGAEHGAPPEEPIRIVAADALRWLAGPAGPRPFDIVFVDPPFASGDDAPLRTILPMLTTPGWLNDDARVYVEWPAAEPAPWDDRWRELKETRAGDSRGALLRPAASDDD